MKNLFRKIRKALINLVDRIAEADRCAVRSGMYHEYAAEIMYC